MRTCSAQTRTDRFPRGGARGLLSGPGPAIVRPDYAHAAGLTLVELLVVISFISLLALMAQMNLFGVLRRNTFKSQVQDFVSMMQMAVSRAAESGHRFEMIINIPEQSYLLRELTTSDLAAEPLVEQTITEGVFTGSCRVAYVEFDDGTYTNEVKAKFRAGHAGWQYGGKVVFLDESEQKYAVIVNRVTPIIQLIEGDPPLMTPKTKEQVPFL